MGIALIGEDMKDNLSKYLEFSEYYKNFIYKAYNFDLEADELRLYFDYEMSGENSEKISFTHRVSYRSKALKDKTLDDIKVFENLIFSIGLVECINYYKTACPKNFVIECGGVSREQEAFWQKLFYNGLGEFIYLNGLTDVFSSGKLFDFKSKGENVEFNALKMDLKGFLLPVGGGKDSVVTMELLKEYRDDILPFVMSAPKASYDCIEVGGYSDYLFASRVFDKKLFDLNEKGFLNGHVPFSAILAFISVLGAAITGKKYIALSNENSANEPTVHGQTFNHQYSKSYEFEKDFFEYSRKYLLEDVYYFSFLRPLYEIEIARIFSGFEQYLPVFRSCNRGKKENAWCGNCSKCLFVYIILYPYVESSVLLDIFGRDLLADESMTGIFEDLIGLTDKKPFECVGTVSEIRYSLKLALEKQDSADELPFLLAKYRDVFKDALEPKAEAGEHNVPLEFTKLLEAK